MELDAVFSKMKELAEKWFAGELSDKRFAEIIAGLLNKSNVEEKDNVRN